MNWRISKQGNRFCETRDKTVAVIKSNNRGILQVQFTPAVTFDNEDEAEAYAEEMLRELDFGVP